MTLLRFINVDRQESLLFSTHHPLWSYTGIYAHIENYGVVIFAAVVQLTRLPVCGHRGAGPCQAFFEW